MLKKNDIVTGICENYTHSGDGVVKIDGFPLFVKGILADEEAEILVLKTKKTYGFGKVVRLIKESPNRVVPKCPLFGKCGGCQLQHMSTDEQVQFKLKQVQEMMKRIGHLDIKVDKITSMKQPWNYRNKGQIPVGHKDGRVQMGFYRINSNTIIDMKKCLIQSEAINEIAAKCKDLFQKYNVYGDMRHLLIKHAFSTGEIMVVLIARRCDIKNLDAFVSELVKHNQHIVSVILNINTRNDNVILGDKEVVLYGSDFIVDELDGLKFQISSKSFYQVNPIQTVSLYQKALEFAQLTGNEHVIDLYCGVGTISLFMARNAKKVTGIEIIQQAIENAKINAEFNHMKHVEFICDDAQHYASMVCEQNMHPDVVMIDPPRKGCDEITIQSIVKMNPKRVVYVSCDPSTLARDLKYFNELGYMCEDIHLFDQFPFTYHVESVVLMSGKNA